MKELTKITVIQEPAALFAAGFTSQELELTNYSMADLVLVTGVGSKGPSTITIEGRRGETGEFSPIAFSKRNEAGNIFERVEKSGDIFMLGGETGQTGKVIYRVSGADLAKEGFDRLRVKGTKYADWSGVPGSITAVLYNPRYNE